MPGSGAFLQCGRLTWLDSLSMARTMKFRFLRPHWGWVVQAGLALYAGLALIKHGLVIETGKAGFYDWGGAFLADVYLSFTLLWFLEGEIPEDEEDRELY